MSRTQVFDRAALQARKPMTVPGLAAAKAAGEPITMLTCYDFSHACLCDAAGVDILLVGDSLGMVLQGHDSTLPVRLEDMAYHVASVARAQTKALVLADMPWGSYQVSPEQAYENAAHLMAVGAQMVKLEGGGWLASTVAFLKARGIPVCAHLGLTPQSVHALGGYRVQGRGAAGEALIEDALALEAAGADLVLVELIPSPLGKRLTEALTVPTIGIGAGPDLGGQVLVLHDILGVTPGRKARFVKNYLSAVVSAETELLQAVRAAQPDMAGGWTEAAVAAYVAEVKAGAYPGPEHGFGD